MKSLVNAGIICAAILLSFSTLRAEPLHPVAPAMTPKPGSSVSPSVDPQPDSDDKKAFVRARNAAKTGTWTAAIKMLDSIDNAKLDDPDVVTYVDFSMKCAKTAEALGVSIKSDPGSILDVVKGVDFVKLAAKLWKEGIVKSAEIVSQAKEVYDGMEMYGKLDEKLCKKFDITD